MRVLVTGANGFVGSYLCRYLQQQGIQVRGACRSPDADLPEGTEKHVIGEIGETTDWRAALEEVDGVVHLAGRVHVMGVQGVEELDLYRSVNTFGTLHLARQARDAGVRRFVFMSSIKVNGEGRKTPYTESDAPAPQDPYAISKYEAELGLQKLSARTGMSVVIVRPPLVYGPGVGANFLRLIKSVDRGYPLPFGNIGNRRSLVFVGNLADAVVQCLENPAAAGKTYLVSDGRDLSTGELVRLLSGALGRSPRLIAIPRALLQLVGVLFGKGVVMKRLFESLAVDTGRIREELTWTPPFSIETGLAETAKAYRQCVIKV